MIDYLKQQDRQMMGDALRGTVASGGTQSVAPPSSLSASAADNGQMWANNMAQNQQQNAGNSDLAKDLGKQGAKWVNNNYFNSTPNTVDGVGPTNTNRGGQGMWDDFTSMFSGGGSGGGIAGGLFGSGGGNGAAYSASASPHAEAALSSGGGGAGGMASAGGYAAAALAASLAAGNLLNSDPDKWYSADKINSYGTVDMGGKDVGFRFGDLANGINPATWVDDPKKGASGLLNFFTGGIFD